MYVCALRVYVEYVLGNGPGRMAYMWMMAWLYGDAKTICRQASGHYRKNKRNSSENSVGWFEEYCFPVMYTFYALTF